MTTPAIIRQADLRRFADIAQEKGCTIEIVKDGTTIRLTPERPEQKPATIGSKKPLTF